MAHVPPYAQVLRGLGVDTIDPASPRTSVDTAFLRFLIAELARTLPFDAAYYLAHNADVAAALAAGRLADPREHWVEMGYGERRLPGPPAFDAATYLAANPDLAALHAKGGDAALVRHHAQSGHAEGRVAHAATEPAARRWQAAAAATPPHLSHRTMRQALVMAYRGTIMAAPGIGFHGGLVLDDGPADRPLRHRRGGKPVDSFPAADAVPEQLAGAYVYAGPYHPHFGHAMAETIHRILPGRSLFNCRRLLFVGSQTVAGCPRPGPMQGQAGHAALPPVLQAALAMLDVDPDDVTVIHDDTVVETLHVAQQGADLAGDPSPAYLDLLDRFTPARLAAAHPQAAPGGRVYVSRSEMAHGGTFLGEAYLEGLLAREGWHVVQPQHMTLAAQMACYVAAEVVVFPEGSAVHGAELLWRGSIARCILLPRREGHARMFARVLRPRCRQLDLWDCTRMLGSLVGNADGVPQEHLGVHLLDLPALARMLRAAGLATLPTLDPVAYRAAVARDLDRYRTHHRTRNSPPVSPPEQAAFEARCAAALAPA